uniref:Transposase n=1 Tax=blood disease bacterium R229 TaxID=741978 RepID=G2ZWV4_9RALS
MDVTQELLVRQLIADKTPDQLKMPYALWTRAAVGQLIEQCFGIRLAVRTVGLYLSRWGFMSQKSVRKVFKPLRLAV